MRDWTFSKPFFAGPCTDVIIDATSCLNKWDNYFEPNGFKVYFYKLEGIADSVNHKLSSFFGDDRLRVWYIFSDGNGTHTIACSKRELSKQNAMNFVTIFDYGLRGSRFKLMLPEHAEFECSYHLPVTVSGVCIGDAYNLEFAFLSGLQNGKRLIQIKLSYFDFSM